MHWLYSGRLLLCVRGSLDELCYSVLVIPRHYCIQLSVRDVSSQACNLAVSVGSIGTNWTRKCLHIKRYTHSSLGTLSRLFFHTDKLKVMVDMALVIYGKFVLDTNEKASRCVASSAQWTICSVPTCLNSQPWVLKYLLMTNTDYFQIKMWTWWPNQYLAFLDVQKIARNLRH